MALARFPLAFLLLLAACGTGEDAALARGPGPDGPAVCDLAATAVTLVGEADPCPPDHCVVDARAGTVRCQGQAQVLDGYACTRFVMTDDSCGSPCAPPTCRATADHTVRCAPGCAPEATTCFAIADGACPDSALP